MINSGQERRKHLRLDNNVPLKISSSEFDVVTETKNISSSGAYCRINKYLEPMTKIKIHLLLPIKRNNRITTKKISCQGVIVRTESNSDQSTYNIAIFFNEISQKDSQVLNDYINSIVEQKPVSNSSV